MNAIVALISAVSVFAASAAFVDFGAADLGFAGLHGAGALVKGVHHGAHVAHFVAGGEVVDGLKCGAHFSWVAPAGKAVKEVLAFSHCKKGGLVLFHLTFTDGTEGFFHFFGGVAVPVSHHVWLAKLAKGVCKHAPAFFGLPHHALLADLAHVLA
ncbi:signal peptide-containing protein [Theileria equi strain WA]|uniref:Signal peptide-containing protein n=1 Tax=Theileria equi strain WA TaxID=1537102 RepID=L0AZC0_THEEQ|nr:signal peptide-containing protein [Theileria equi strain WA]AFZ80613.1 signal peptide-containing protein [Theileria equi strain WA]|eukprot:XP_004830279.1 signal peptide-containing protein [Theileria equi strain WA]